MKKSFVFTIMIVLIGLLLVTTQVFAIDTQANSGKPTPKPKKTEQAVAATARAEAKAERQAETQKRKRFNFMGTVEAIDAANITIALKDGSTVTIVIHEKTRIKIPTIKNATWEAISTGMRAKIRAYQAEGDVLTALSIHVIPGKPTKIHRVGTVSAYTAGASITILAKDGNEYTFLLAEEVKILPEERANLLDIGVWVTIIAPRDVTSGTPTAKGIVVHPLK